MVKVLVHRCTEDAKSRLKTGREGTAATVLLQQEENMIVWRNKRKIQRGLNRGQREHKGLYPQHMGLKIRPTQAHIERERFGHVILGISGHGGSLRTRLSSSIMAAGRPRRSTRAPAKYQETKLTEEETRTASAPATKKRKTSPSGSQDVISPEFLLTNPKSPLINVDFSVSK